jgi:hypothetical protein
MSTSAVIMLVGAASLFALFASALAWAQLHAHRFTAIPVNTVAAKRAKRRAF